MRDFKESFLREYFTVVAAADKMMSTEKNRELFFDLAKAFLIDDKSADMLWEITQRPSVKDVANLNDVKMNSRVSQYITQIMKVGIGRSEEADMISVKGEAIERAEALELIAAQERSNESVFQNIVFKAGEGCLAAIRLLAIMQLKGIFIEKDVESGLKNLARAATWNDVGAGVMYLYYGGGYQGESMCNRLLTILEYRCFKDLANLVGFNYAQYATGKSDEVAILLEKAFGVCVLDRQSYCATKARIMFSDIISLSGKEAIIYSMDIKQLHSPICDLPLKLKTNVECEIYEEAFKGAVLQRPFEQKHILREARNFDLCKTLGYMPMCLHMDSSVVMRENIENIRRLLPKANVEVIEVRGLTADDMARGYNNIFIKSCEEDKFNVYVLVFRGMIDNSVMEEALKFLQASKRRSFRLSSGVELDLSCILPICVCDSVNDKILKKYCNMIDLADVSADEKRALTDDILSRKAQLYGIDAVKLDDNARLLLEQLSVDNIERSLDRAILNNRDKCGSLVLSMQVLGKILADYKSNNKFGFGGSINEDK